MKQYKPFDLSRAKLGEPVITRDGRKARIVCFDKKGTYPLVALVEMGDYENTFSFKNDGCFAAEANNESDLFMAPVKRTVWVNVYKVEQAFTTGQIVYSNKQTAEQTADEGDNYLGAYPIEIED